jgi:hypothetical protein
VSWSLSASGHASDPAQEKKLARMIGQLLAEAGTVVTSASFSGSSYSGDPRGLAEINEAEPVQP